MKSTRFDFHRVIRAIEFIMLIAGALFFGTLIFTLMIEAIERNTPGVTSAKNVWV